MGTKLFISFVGRLSSLDEGYIRESYSSSGMCAHTDRPESLRLLKRDAPQKRSTDRKGAGETIPNQNAEKAIENAQENWKNVGLNRRC